jgi:hypothetical protein
VLGSVQGADAVFTANGWRVMDLIDPYWRLAIDCTDPSIAEIPYLHCS